MYQSTNRFIRVFVPEKKESHQSVIPAHTELRLKPEFNKPSIKRASVHIPRYAPCSIREGAGKCRMCLLGE